MYLLSVPKAPSPYKIKKNRRVAEIQIFEKTYLIVIKDETGL